MNGVWGIRWARGDRRRRALLALALAVRAVPARAGVPDAVPRTFPPTELRGAILHLLRGVSGRRQVELAPASRGGVTA